MLSILINFIFILIHLVFVVVPGWLLSWPMMIILVARDTAQNRLNDFGDFLDEIRAKDTNHKNDDTKRG